jgi:hypothetical protein
MHRPKEKQGKKNTRKKQNIRKKTNQEIWKWKI